MYLILSLETHYQLSLKYSTIFISHASCQSVAMKFNAEFNAPQTMYPYYFGDLLTFHSNTWPKLSQSNNVV